MIKLIRHHVLVKLDDATEANEIYRRAKAAGIHLELDKREKAAVEIGTVIQVGPTAFVDLGVPINSVKEGDRVSFARYAGKSIVDDGVEYFILNDDDILAVIN